MILARLRNPEGRLADLAENQLPDILNPDNPKRRASQIRHDR